VLIAPEGRSILVPAIRGLEIANAILVGERQKRIRQPEIARFTVLLENLAPLQDSQPVQGSLSRVLPLARRLASRRAGCEVA